MNSIGIDDPETIAVAFLAGYTANGGAFNNPKGSLRSRGYIKYNGSKLQLTDLGRDNADTPTDALTNKELHDKVLERLPSPEQKLLRPLIEIYPEDMSYEELAEKSSYAPNGGAFNNPRGRLRTLGLVEYTSSGRLKAAEVLFIE